MLSPLNQTKFNSYFALQRVRKKLLTEKQIAKNFDVDLSTARYFISLFLEEYKKIQELRQKCILPQIEGFDSKESTLRIYFDSLNKRSIRKLRKRPCTDCAANCLYAGIAVGAYRHLETEERKMIVSKWECHHGGRCEGAAEILDVP